jgi:hypothetical protein
MAKSYRGVDDYGLGLTWTVVRRGSIVVKGRGGCRLRGKKIESRYMCSAICENRIGRPTLREHTSYHTVNPAKAQVVHRAG